MEGQTIEECRRRSRVQAKRLVQAVVQRRIAVGLTETDVASRMGITPADVAQLERETDWLLSDYIR